ncbi:MAG: ACP S-malonyltransferase [Actinobacteria bacterium]|nr:ACP S-malonyltransferase [Actinomycetota bacterium]
MVKTAFVFPGQGSQYVGMGFDLVKNFSEADRIFKKADDILGRSISSLCFNGPLEDLSLTNNLQPAIFTLSCAYLTLIEKFIKPDFVAGHSLGEYTAVAASGALDFSETLKLLQVRANAMAEAASEKPGAMLAVLGLNVEKLKDVISPYQNDGVIEIANYNCPGQIVLSGEIEMISRMEDALKSAGVRKTVRLPVSGGFHSPLMSSARKKFADYIEKISFQDVKIPLVSNYTARPAIKGEEIKENLIKQIDAPVLWEDSVLFMIGNNVKMFVEAGPGKVLKGLLKRISQEVKAISVEDFSSIDELVENVRSLKS